MSAPLYGTRPPISDPGSPARTDGISVSTRLIHLDPGWFSLALMPIRVDPATGLPGIRVSLPPGPPGRRETVSISTMRGDGWVTANDEPIMLRVGQGGGDILITHYWSALDLAGSPPALKLTRLNPDEPGAASSGTIQAGITQSGAARIASPPGAEIVAHIEGIGDVDGKLGDWVGMRGSGRSIEGFSLEPRQGISTEDFDVRAVLGRDWLSPWIPGGRYCGSRGLALPLRGFCLRLHPMAAARYEVACNARFVDGAEVAPAGAELICAAPSMAALEAFQLRVRPRTL